jgi:hypothetical protein
VRSPDARIARIAGRQHGVFTVGQATSCGFTPRTIEYRLKTGRWQSIHRGVYRLAGGTRTFEQRTMAAVLAGGASAVASHRAAGALFRLEGIEQGTIEILVPRARRVRQKGIRVHRAELVRADVARISGIPVTTPARTLIDLASVIARDPLEDALDDAVRRKLVHPRSLESRLEGMQRRGSTGAGVLLSLVKKRTTRNVAGSGRENRVRRALVKAGLPEPVRQFEIFDRDGTFVARPDLSYPDHRVYIEYDGARHFDPRQREADLERQNRLSCLGWRPLTFIDADLRRPPSVLVAKVRAALSWDGSPG